MVDATRPQTPELRGPRAVVAISLVIIALGAGAAWGWKTAGPMGGMLGILLGAAVGALIFTVIRLTAQAEQLADRPVPDVRELEPDQALQVLSALMSAGASAEDSLVSMTAFAGGLLGEIGKARHRAKEMGDPDGALALLKSLAEANPRSPAVPAELARVHRSKGETEAATRAAGIAIHLALQGGMNRLAGKVFSELDQADHDNLVLAGEDWPLLAKVLANAEDEVGVALCKSRMPEA